MTRRGSSQPEGDKNLTMPLQNRVDHYGEIQAVSSRSTLTGNRGILHGEDGVLHRKYQHQNWVTCALQFNDRKRALMAPGRYTHLFFLDEATAFAAGHRPCAECRRRRYKSFVAAWCKVHGHSENGKSLPQTIDRILHANRVVRGGTKVTYQAPLAGLPDGTFFADRGKPVLVWKGARFRWSFEGYRQISHQTSVPVTVLTPRPVVEVFAAGWTPDANV